MTVIRLDSRRFPAQDVEDLTAELLGTIERIFHKHRTFFSFGYTIHSMIDGQMSNNIPIGSDIDALSSEIAPILKEVNSRGNLDENSVWVTLEVWDEEDNNCFGDKDEGYAIWSASNGLESDWEILIDKIVV